MAYRFGVDVGDTFTDLLLLDASHGRFWRHKTPSTRLDSSGNILTGRDLIGERRGIAKGAAVITVALTSACVGGSHETAAERLRKRCEAETGFPATERPVWPDLEAAN